MNHGSYVGRLTADPELKQTQNRIGVCSFTLAIDRPGTRDKTDFINFVAWRQTAEFICKYFRKGQKIALTGYLTSRQYEDKNGNQRTAFEVVVDRAEFVESRQKAKAGIPAKSLRHTRPSRPNRDLRRSPEKMICRFNNERRPGHGH